MSVPVHVLVPSVTLQLLSVLQSLVIIRFVRGKAPNSLTLVDHVIGDISACFVVFNLILAVGTVAAYLVLLPESLVLGIIAGIRVVYFLVSFNWFAKSVLRYLYIFHWSLITELDDLLVLKVVRASAVVLAGCFVTLEFAFFLEGNKLLYFPVFTVLFRQDAADLLSSGPDPNRKTKGFFTLMTLVTSMIILTIKVKLWLDKRSSSTEPGAQQKDWSQSAKSLLSFRTTILFTVLFILVYVAMERATDLDDQLERKARIYLVVCNFFGNAYPFCVINGRQSFRDWIARCVEKIVEEKREMRDGMVVWVGKLLKKKSPRIQPLV